MLENFHAMVLVNSAVHTTIHTYVVKKYLEYHVRIGCERYTQNDF